MNVIKKLKVRNESGFDEAIDFGAKAENVSYTTYSWNEETQDYTTPKESTAQKELNEAEKDIRKLDEKISVLEVFISNNKEQIDYLFDAIPSLDDISLLETPIEFTEDNLSDQIIITSFDSEEAKEPTPEEVSEDEEDEAEEGEESTSNILTSLSYFDFYFSYAGHAQLPVRLKTIETKGKLISFDVLSETKNIKTTIQFELSIPSAGKAQIQKVRTSTLSFDEENGVSFTVVDGLNELPLSLTEVVGTYY